MSQNWESTTGDSDGRRDICNTEGAANYLHTTGRHIGHLAATGELAHFRVGRYLRFRRQDLDGYLAGTYVAAKRTV